ncbi:MAG TPA: aldehyde dehydrogenase family protein [Jatrophihabitantaceae bacterium]|jgi:acyl-CoA reductase-like NAD-dependent aldehyde dehydrogenase
MTRIPLADLEPAPSVLLIGEKRLQSASGGTYEHRYAATGEINGIVPLAGASEVDLAAQAASRAFREWSGWTADRRRDGLLRLADLVDQHADELVALSLHDSAFPYAVASLGPSRASGGLRYFAGWADKVQGEVVPVWPGEALDFTLPEPYGVVGIFGTWNTPVYNFGLAIAPALAAGNSVILKPSEYAPFAYQRFGELALEAGLPAGTVNVLTGGVEAGEALLRHPLVSKVHFTGGGQTAYRVLEVAARALKPVDLELGGKSPNIIFPDAVDLQQAVAISMGAIIGGSGQTCITASRMLAHESIYEDVLQIARDLASRVTLGDPFDPDVTMGPVISSSAYERITRMVAEARDEAPRSWVERATDAGPDGGYFVPPAIFADIDPTNRLFQHEVFGPVLTVSCFRSEDEAIAQANATDYGLSAYIQTADLDRALRVAHAIESGSVYVNGRGGLPPGAPFGGVKSSGFGRLGGYEAIAAFTRKKNVWIGRR